MLAPQDDISSCATRTHFLVCHKRRFLRVSQKDLSAWDTNRHFFLCHKKTFPHSSSCFMFHRKKCLAVTQEGVSSGETQEEMPFVTQEEMSSCDARTTSPFTTRRHVFPRRKKKCQDTSSCVTRNISSCITGNISSHVTRRHIHKVTPSCKGTLQCSCACTEWPAMVVQFDINLGCLAPEHALFLF